MPDLNETSQSIIMRQLERLDERTRVMPTKDDINEIKRTMATRDYLDGVVGTIILRVSNLENDVKVLQGEQMSRADRNWLRISQIASLGAVRSEERRVG